MQTWYTVLESLERSLEELREVLLAGPRKSFRAHLYTYTTKDGTKKVFVAPGTGAYSPEYEQLLKARFSSRFSVSAGTDLGSIVFLALTQVDDYFAWLMLNKDCPGGMAVKDVIEEWRWVPPLREAQLAASLDKPTKPLTLDKAQHVQHGTPLIHKEIKDVAGKPFVAQVDDSPILSRVSNDLVRIHVRRDWPDKRGVHAYLLEDALEDWRIAQL